MKPLLLVAAALLGGSVGAGIVLVWGKDRPFQEGVISSVVFQQGNSTGGFTRLNNSKAVPGGNGSWNVDAYGKLYRDFLVITYTNGQTEEIVPVHRLRSISFGDGGIKEMPKTALP